MNQQHDVADQREQSDQSGSSRRSFLGSLGGLTASSGVAIQFGTDISTAAEDGTHSFVGGGENNVASGDYSTVGGGENNAASVIHSVIGGGVSNRSEGNRSVVCGGNTNEASGQESFVGGGENNTANANASLVVGGSDNKATALDSTIGGGYNNHATGFEATIVGGSSNTASGERSYIGGGNGNEASARYSTTSGGDNNVASGYGAIVPGGEGNSAEGSYSYAAGRNAQARNTGAFVWADNSGGSVASTGPNQFIVRAAGGVYFGDENDPSLKSGLINTSTGACLSENGEWEYTATDDSRTDIDPIDADEILEQVRELTIQSWRYEDGSDENHHVGPTAGAFHETFELGQNGETISSADADGVALAAIQALANRNRQLESRLEELEAKVEAE
ncbi:tail fiber domain-containing protein [Natrinema ejinorense]|uniref:tail fiber domain-containing protein n=1 Tax=Natrinema ejinorense TaxID=373386 RepID=UPI00118010C7|nr:hypothetical protein [Natrinema ejinorense]